ncbi:protein of unknown function [Citrobacter amalonaticus]|uniref:Uncharacterized protein n=1 Tax=Citrobacter amalonaticus TaxID=35703 RepID=A0AAX2BNG8_CITAM|nr:protein of unknown function [Citrobacter amalonaticus]
MPWINTSAKSMIRDYIVTHRTEKCDYNHKKRAKKSLELRHKNGVSFEQYGRKSNAESGR